MLRCRPVPTPTTAPHRPGRRSPAIASRDRLLGGVRRAAEVLATEVEGAVDGFTGTWGPVPVASALVEVSLDGWRPDVGKLNHIGALAHPGCAVTHKIRNIGFSSGLARARLKAAIAGVETHRVSKKAAKRH